MFVTFERRLDKSGKYQILKKKFTFMPIVQNTNPHTVVFHPKKTIPVHAPTPVRGPAIVAAASPNLDKIKEAVSIVESIKAQLAAINNALDVLNRIIIFDIQS